MHRFIKHVQLLRVMILLLMPVISLSQVNSRPPKIDSLLLELSSAKVKHVDDTTRALTLVRLADEFKFYHWRSHIGLDSAKLYAQKGLELSEQINYPYGQGVCLIVWGDLAGTNFPLAFDYYFRALHAFEKTNNDSCIADALDHIAGLYFNIHNFADALSYWFKAIDYIKRTSDVYSLARYTHNIGEAYGNIGEHPKALKYEFEALKSFEQQGKSKAVAMALNNIGNSYAALRQYNQAMLHLLKSYKLYASFGRDFKYAMVSDDIAYTYYLIATDSVSNIVPDTVIAAGKKENLARSFKWFTEASSVFNEFPRPEHTKRLAYALGYVGRYKEAFELFKQYLKFRDNELANDVYLKISEQQAQREAELKENQIRINKIELDNNRTERILFSTIVGLLVLLIGLSLRNRRRQKKANNKLALSNSALADEKLKLENANIDISIRKNKADDLATHLQEIITEKDALAAQLSKAADMKSKFLANISHELRTPVTLLTGMLELMKEEEQVLEEGCRQENKVHSKKKKRLHVAYDNSRRLLQMIEEILDLSRLDNGAAKFQQEVKPAAAMIRRMVFAFETFIEKQHILLEYSEHETADVHFAADENLVEKIINNLMYNAIKFNKPGGWIKVVLSVCQEQQKFIISITNPGNIISAEDLPHIFDRFYQAGNSAQRADGVGIGLNLVKEFTGLMNGSVHVDSNEEGGTTLTLKFPVVTALPPDKPVVQDVAVLPTEAWDALSKKHIVLIVEDNVDMRYYLREVLGDHVHLEQAGNGEEALNWMASNKPDLVITDIMMPGIDGEEFVRKLKEDEQYKQIPVITLTALADSTSRLNMLRLGIDDYISKPFDAAELRIRVCNLLNNLEERRSFNNKPAEPEDLPEEATDTLEFKSKVTAFVLARMRSFNISVYDLAYELVLSERQLYRLSKSLTGYSPAQLIKEVRLQKAYELLTSGRISKVEDVSKQVGFEDSNYFSLQFLARFGKKPTAFI